MQTEKNDAPATGIIKKEDLPFSQRFLMAVEHEFTGIGGEITLTSFQKKLCQNYFLKIDSVLREAEIKRKAKPEKYRDPLPLTWDNVNMQRLATDVIAYSAVGMDAMQENHINPIPYKNRNTNKYDITFIPGYKGIEIKARKYGLDVPDNIVVELVYSTDEFKPVKKDFDNAGDSYHFEIRSPFERGDVVGGFYFHEFYKQPEKNKLKVFSKKDIDKRKPEYAAAEFWGGEKDQYVDGQRQGKIAVDGWYDEMAYKTIYRAAYKAITIDSQKIDDHYLAVIEREQETRNLNAELDLSSLANKEKIDFDNDEIKTDDFTGIENKGYQVDPPPVNNGQDINQGKIAVKEEQLAEQGPAKDQELFVNEPTINQGQRKPNF